MNARWSHIEAPSPDGNTISSRREHRAVACGAAIALASLLGAGSAQATCLSGGDVQLCEEPVDGQSPGANVVGGTMLAGQGYRVDAKGDYITYDLGTTFSSGALRFKVSGISPDTLWGDTHIVLLITDTPDVQDDPGHSIEIIIWGFGVDPSVGGTLNFSVGGPIGGGVFDGVTKRKKLDWNGSEYRFDVSWDEPSQHMTLDRDGQSIMDFHTGDLMPGPNNPPIEMQYRYLHLALPCCVNNAAFQPVEGAIYTLVSLAAEAVGLPPDPGGGGAGGEPPETGGAGGSGDNGGSGDAGGFGGASAGTGGTTSGDPPLGNDGVGGSGASGIGGHGAPALESLDDPGHGSADCACGLAGRGRGPWAPLLFALLVLGGLARASTGRARPRALPRAGARGATSGYQDPCPDGTFSL